LLASAFSGRGILDFVYLGGVGIHLILLPNLESSLLEIFLEEFEVFVKLLPEGFVFDRDVGSDGILFVAIEEQEQGVIRDG
jgi:hypothetical protein